MQVTRNAGAAVEQGWGAVKELQAMETYKNTKKSLIKCLFPFRNNVDLKNNNINYRKPF